MRVIINRLRRISDPYIMQTFFNMDTAMEYSSRVQSSLPSVNGLASYSFKIMDFNTCALRVHYLGYLIEQSQQEVQTLDVARDTMIKAKSDFNPLYRDKVEASQVLSNLNYSKLMMEVKWLLANKLFNP